MTVQLTETAITKAVKDARATKTRRDLADAGLPGLRLRVTPAGGRSWVLACRDREGRMRRFPLGSHPTLGVSEARDAARAMAARVREGADPIADRRRQRAAGAAAKEGVGTLSAVLDAFGAGRGAEMKSWSRSRVRVERVFKPLLARPASVLTAGDLQLQADTYPAKQSSAFAVRTLRPVLKWAAEPGRRYVAPELAQLATPATPRQRQRVLATEELTALLPVLKSSDQAHARALRMMLLTLARRDEVCMARWGDIDLTARVWTLAAGATKNGQVHKVPLSRQAAELLAAIGPGKPGALIFATRAGTVLGNWDRATKAIQAASGTAGWHRHDLRRTGATLLGEMGEMPDIIEAALNHVSIHSQLAATYNRARYRPAVAAALQRLADALDGIEAGGAQVVQLRRAAEA